MKKVTKITLLILLAAAVLVAVPLIISRTPRTPIKADCGVPERIEVQYGGGSMNLTITDPEALAWITDAFRGDEFRWNGSALGPGWSFRLTFVFGGDEGRTSFILQNRGELRIGFSFYAPVSGESYAEVYDYLDSLT